MGLELPPELEEMVQTMFLSGKFADEVDVVREALGLLGKRDQLRRDIAEGLAQLDTGEGFDSEEIFGELEAMAAKLTDSDQ